MAAVDDITEVSGGSLKAKQNQERVRRADPASVRFVAVDHLMTYDQTYSLNTKYVRGRWSYELNM
jgi:hypothetical protein